MTPMNQNLNPPRNSSTQNSTQLPITANPLGYLSVIAQLPQQSKDAFSKIPQGPNFPSQANLVKTLHSTSQDVMKKTREQNYDIFPKAEEEVHDMQAMKGLRPDCLLTADTEGKTNGNFINLFMTNVNHTNNYNSFQTIKPNTFPFSNYLGPANLLYPSLQTQQHRHQTQLLNQRASLLLNQPNIQFGELQSQTNNINPLILNHQDSLETNQTKLDGVMASKTLIIGELRKDTKSIHEGMMLVLNDLKNLRETLQQKSLRESCVNIPVENNIQNMLDFSSEIIMSRVLNDHQKGVFLDMEYRIDSHLDIQLPLYKERNFKLAVNLINKRGELVKNMDGFSLGISVYSSDTIPQKLELNNIGNKILKGISTQVIANGMAVFDKLQVTEVTSHLRNGWIFLVVHALNPQNSEKKFNNTILAGTYCQRIQPLIIDKVIVKSKKTAEA